MWFMPNMLSNHDCNIVSLGKVCSFLARKAEALDVEIYPGFAAVEVLYNNDGAVIGVVTGDMGVEKDGTHGANYMRGMALYGKYTLIGEGERGSLAKQIIQKFMLDKRREPQNYGIGISELWQVSSSKHMLGLDNLQLVGH